MGWEVEIKGRVKDPAELLKKLHDACEFLGPLHKEDLYFTGPDGHSSRFRIRREGQESRVTIKSKRIHFGGEINREVEFTVGSAEEFEEFARLLGCRRDYRKVKKGYRFVRGGALVELCEVEPLGWFIEIEKLLTDGGEKELSAAQGEVRELLFFFGLTPGDVEPRFYSALIAEAKEAGLDVPGINDPSIPAPWDLRNDS